MLQSHWKRTVVSGEATHELIETVVPWWMQDRNAHAPIFVNVGVPHFRSELHIRWVVGKVFRENELRLEQATLAETWEPQTTITHMIDPHHSFKWKETEEMTDALWSARRALDGHVPFEDVGLVRSYIDILRRMVH